MRRSSGSWASWATVTLLLLATAATADDAQPLEDYVTARNRGVEAISSGDVETIREHLDPDGIIVFSLEQRVASSLGDWIEGFESAITAGVKVDMKDLESRSGGSGDTGWTWSRQALSWTRPDETEPFAFATWNTTEVWERKEGVWKLVHVHHSAADPLSAENETNE